MVKEDSSKVAGHPEESTNALAARRARLRGSLAKQTLPPDPYAAGGNSPVSNMPSGNEPEPKITPATAVGAPVIKPINKEAKETKEHKENKEHSEKREVKEHKEPVNESIVDAGALSLLNNIDQALGSCAMHLASLQKVATKQIDELKVIAQTLQEHTFSEVGTNLNSLMQSLTAAVEPMKAVGELVPTLDRLVSASEVTSKTQLSEEQLVVNLADQLFNGVIDAWTFKSAYMAIFPDEDTTSLLHRLSELLGEQRLSGDLFQVSYEAVQSAEAPASLSSAFSTVDQIASEQTLLDRTYFVDEQIEEEINKKIAEREEELSKQLLVKEEELQELKRQFDHRWQSLVDECEDLRAALQSREEALKEREVLLRERDEALNKKIAELTAKDSENQQLRTQMEELRDQTKEMVTDLQKQLAQKHIEESNALLSKPQSQAQSSGFFDFVPAGGQSAGLFESVGNAQFAAEEIEEEDTASNVGQPFSSISSQTNLPTVSPANPLAAPNMSANTSVPQSNVPAPSVPQPAQTQTASFVSAAGSYGSGVRAQVFEVIVRQALAGTHWREICAVPMQINNISPDEVEAEVKRRQALLNK